MTLAQQLVRAINKLPPPQQKRVLEFVASLGEKETSDPLDQTKLGRLVKKVRAEKVNDLPIDFASQVDHYAYGVPKR